MKYFYLFVGFVAGISIMIILFRDVPFFKGYLFAKLNKDLSKHILCLSRALDLSCNWLANEDQLLVTINNKYPDLKLLNEPRSKSYFINYCMKKANESINKEVY